MPADFAVGSPAQAAAPEGQKPPAAPRLFHDEETPTWGDSLPDGGEDTRPSPGSDPFSSPTWDLDAAAEPEERDAAPEGDTTTATPKPEEPKGPSVDELQQQLQAAKAELENLSKRFADTQRYANQEHMVGTVAQALVQAQQQKDYIEQQLRERAAAAAPPDLGDLDELLSDSKRLQSALQSYGEWGYRRAVGDLSPHIAQVQADMQMVAAARPLIEDYARERAKNAIVAKGVLDAAQAEKLIDRAVNEVINREQQAAIYRLQPRAIEIAANFLLDSEGAPIKAKPKETPSAGTGDQKRPARRSGLSTSGEKISAFVANQLGVQFDDNDRAELARMNRGA